VGTLRGSLGGILGFLVFEGLDFGILGFSVFEGLDFGVFGVRGLVVFLAGLPRFLLFGQVLVGLIVAMDSS
jgi:hypothetical protein